MLLDLLIPDVDGISICRELRTFSKAAMVMITALNHGKEIMDAYEAGADSVIVKPFQFHVALAQITAVMRRAFPAHRLRGASASILANANIKKLANEVVLNGRTAYLSVMEYRVFSLHRSRVGRPLSKQALLMETWNDSNPKNRRVVEQTIKRLRKKTDSGPSAKKHIVTCSHGYYVYCR